MDFFDCNVCYGMDILGSAYRPAYTVQDLQKELKRAGIQKAMVWRAEQMDGGVVMGNELLARDLAAADNLYGIWGILPSHTHELPEPSDLIRQMKENRIYGWRMFPAKSRFLPKPFVIRDWLEAAVRHHIPLFFHTGHGGTTLDGLTDILSSFPDLTVVLTFADVWPSDRLFRPFVKEYPNVYIDLTYNITDGGIESFVKESGADRLLYGSGFPLCYFGGNMLALKHADIGQEEKTAIAGGNLTRILEEVVL